ncbi:unnamed protein product, partial [Closterium sp. Naga37s-1]
LPAAVRQQLQQEGLWNVTTYEQRLDYSYWPADHVLRMLLPPGVEVPTAFETVGHIAHVNLRDDLLPYRFVIGKVLLQKNAPLIRAVVNKSGIIENEFRVPTLDLIAGEGSSSHLPTSVRQHGATFHLDYARVYWNSRLEHEHKRLVDAFFKRGEVVVDMFAGVGPFAVPAAKAGCAVLANDLNPASVEYLRRNVRVNGVERRVRAYNEDARVFVRGVLKPPEGGEGETVARGVEGSLEEGMEGKKEGGGEAGGMEKSQQEEGGNVEREQQRAVARGVKRERGDARQEAEKREGEGMEVEGVGEQRVEVGSAKVGEDVAAAGRGVAEGVRGSRHGQEVREVGEKDGEGREAAGGQGCCETAGGSDTSDGGVGRAAGEGMQGAGMNVETAEEVREGGTQEQLGEGKEEQKGGRTGRKGKGKRKGGKGESKEGKDGGGIEVALVAPWRHVDHVVMNLPASAITFLDSFRGAFSRAHWEGALPLIHTYCFHRSGHTAEAVTQEVERHLGAAVDAATLSIHPVRNVAPNKLLCERDSLGR